MDLKAMIMTAVSFFCIVTLVLLIAAFFIDTWHAVYKNAAGYQDMISSLGFCKESPWMRTMIKLPIIVWIGFKSIALGERPLDRIVIICWLYIIIVFLSMRSFYRNTTATTATQQDD